MEVIFMALIRFGGGVVGMSGSIAGDTFARNRSGNYARARTKPVNLNSVGQVAVRAAVSYLANYWKNTLDAAERTAWDLYASSVAMKNRLGESIYLTGFNHFVRSNSITKRQAGTITEAAPTNFTLSPSDPEFAVTITANNQKISVAFDDTLEWDSAPTGRLFLFMGVPQNPSHMFFAGPWRFAGEIGGNTPVPTPSPVELDCPFVATTGQKVWCYARTRIADGRLSEPFRSSVLVTAGA